MTSEITSSWVFDYDTTLSLNLPSSSGGISSVDLPVSIRAASDVYEVDIPGNPNADNLQYPCDFEDIQILIAAYMQATIHDCLFRGIGDWIDTLEPAGEMAGWVDCPVVIPQPA